MIEGEYIRKEDVISIIKGNWLMMQYSDDAIQASLDMIKDLRAADVVERSLYNQVLWERDIALAQLAVIGKGLGEKMDDIKAVL